MSVPYGLIRIPVNEEKSSSKRSGQIEEFLMQFNGEGIQHIALKTDDLSAALVDRLKSAGVPLDDPAPSPTYYEMLEERLPGHGLNVPDIQSRGILVDGSSADGKPRLLLQIFSRLRFLGPAFFEFIPNAATTTASVRAISGRRFCRWNAIRSAGARSPRSSLHNARGSPRPSVTSL